MPRRAAPAKYVAPGSAITPLTNVPGPEADGPALKAHYSLVQEAFATHRYDDVLYIWKTVNLAATTVGGCGVWYADLNQVWFWVPVSSANSWSNCSPLHR